MLIQCLHFHIFISKYYKKIFSTLVLISKSKDTYDVIYIYIYIYNIKHTKFLKINVIEYISY
jgi:hypothetical protein